MRYNKPPLDLLNKNAEKGYFDDRILLQELMNNLDACFRAFNVDAIISDVVVTPLAATFDVVLSEGTKVKKVRDMLLDLECFLSYRVEIFIVGEILKVALKVPERPIVRLRTLLESKQYIETDAQLKIAVGVDLIGDMFTYDLVNAPHMLVAGTTGSGKTVFIDDIILSIVYNSSPQDVRFLMVDPMRGVELNVYNDLPHMLRSVITTHEETLSTMEWLEDEMMRRYDLFSKVNARNIDSYNENVDSNNKMFRIVFLIDEYMDIITNSPKELNDVIERIARLGRATGIHLIIATKVVYKSVVTSHIKANIPCRASFVVVDNKESRAIIDSSGAERLLGCGDMIFSDMDDIVPAHLQAPYVDIEEVKKVVTYIKEHNKEWY